MNSRVLHYAVINNHFTVFIHREKFFRCAESESGTTTPCPDEGISVPAIEYGGAAPEFFAFSEFWYSMEDVLKMGGPYSPATLQKAARVRFLLSSSICN